MVYSRKWLVLGGRTNGCTKTRRREVRGRRRGTGKAREGIRRSSGLAVPNRDLHAKDTCPFLSSADLCRRAAQRDEDKKGERGRGRRLTESSARIGRDQGAQVGPSREIKLAVALYVSKSSDDRPGGTINLFSQYAPHPKGKGAAWFEDAREFGIGRFGVEPVCSLACERCGE